MRRRIGFLSALLVIGFLVGCLGVGGQNSGPPRINARVPAEDHIKVLLHETLVFSVSATDPDGDRLYYRWDHTGQGDLTATKTGTATWRAPGINGFATVTVTVTDEKGAVVFHTWEITVGQGHVDHPDFLERKAAIQARHSQLLDEFNQDPSIYKRTPRLQGPNYDAGSLAEGFLNDGLLMTNFIRFLAYLDDDVKLTDAWNISAQHGAVLNLVNGKLTHEPDQPTDMDDHFYELGLEGARTSNIAFGAGYDSMDLPDTIFLYLSDSDPGNIAVVGHRRWILNPAMTDVGFGWVSKDNHYYSAMKIRDASTNSINSYTGVYDYICWPSPSAFPIEFFDDNDPWSVSLNHRVYDNRKTEAIKVTVKNVNLNREWVFTDQDLDTSSAKYYNAETGGYGVPFCLIFRPDDITYRDGHTYEVRIENIYRAGGEKTSISFSTTFFAL